jgi:hypothetical protein
MKQKIAILIILALVTGLLLVFLKAGISGPEERFGTNELPTSINYNFHVKPILADKCYACHGPDQNKRKAGLRLDVVEGAFKELEDNPGNYAIVPGKPGASVMYRRIHADDETERMPPPESMLSLNTYEKGILKRWIEQGAQFERHWSFIPPIKAELPNSSNPGWIQNEIDAFVLKKLEANQLQPSGKAAIATLIRRISLDLTGLPPDPEQLR